MGTCYRFRPSGRRVNLFGGCAAGSQVRFDPRHLHYNEITLFSAFYHTPTYVQKALHLLSFGVLDPRPLITQQMSLASFEEALKAVEAGTAVKVLFIS